MSQQQPNPRGEDTDAEAETDTDLSHIPESAREALPDHLKGKLEEGEARLATEDDVLVDEDETWWEWMEVTIRGEAMLVGFEFRQVAWQRKNQIFNNALKTRPNGETSLEIDVFQREVAAAKIVDHTIPTEYSLTQLLTGMDNNVGEKLDPYLPDPGGAAIEEDEEKN